MKLKSYFLKFDICKIMSMSRRGSSMLSDTPMMMRRPVSESNVFLDLMVSSFYTVIGYVCLDIVFAITLHYIGVNNPESQAGLGLAFIIVNTLMIPMGLGKFANLTLRNKSIVESSFSSRIRSIKTKASSELL